MKATIEDLRNMVKKQVQEHLELTEGPFDDIADAMKATSDKIASLRQSRRAATGGSATDSGFGSTPQDIMRQGKSGSLIEFFSHFPSNLRGFISEDVKRIMKKYDATIEEAKRLEADLITARKDNPLVFSDSRFNDLDDIEKTLNGPNGESIWNEVRPGQAETLFYLLQNYSPDKNKLDMNNKKIFSDISSGITKDSLAGPEQFETVKNSMMAAGNSLSNILSKYAKIAEGKIQADVEAEINYLTKKLIRRNDQMKDQAQQDSDPETSSDEEIEAALDQINAPSTNTNTIIPGETD